MNETSYSTLDSTPGDIFGLRGQVCVVTGAASGIGRAIAQALAAHGAKVAVLDRDLAGREATADMIHQAGGQALAFAVDTGVQASVQSAAQEVAAQLGPCNVLVNNAGMLRPGPLASLCLAEWQAVLDVNLTGYFLCAQAFGAQMRALGGGTLVHTASIAADHATAHAGAYSVAKAGVQMLSRQLALEWAADHIRSNAVCPGMIYTPMSASLYNQPGVTERRSQAIPSGRIGRPEDIAQAVLFLASPRSAYVNGQELTVDGGFTRMLMSLVPRVGYEGTAR